MKTFEELSRLNVSDKVEKKNNLAYLSWAFAWAELKKNFPDAAATVYETQDTNGNTVNYFTDGRTCYVKVGIRLTPDGIETVEMLPVMDFRNASIPAAKVTSYDVNKTIQRCKTKAIAEATGIGLYIYAGEDLPEEEPKAAPAPREEKKLTFTCSECGALIANTIGRNGEEIAASDILSIAKKNYGRPLCAPCMKKIKAKEALQNG